MIGDIKKSKKLNNRNTVQNVFKKVLNSINEKYSKDISSKFMITLGDELQGLLHDGSNVMNIIEEIQRELYPVEIRLSCYLSYKNYPITTYNVYKVFFDIN